MTAITLILTDAGLAALTNPAHTGTAALTISHIGLSQQHAGDAAVQQALTALPGEFKRLATFGGEVLSPRTIHVFLRDESADAYSLRAIGLYTSTGVLLAVVSSDTPMMEKVPATTLLQAIDLTFARDIDAELTFGDTNFVNPPATTTRLGVVELATAAETVSGERQDLAVTPWGMAQALLFWAQNFAAKVHRHVIGDIDGLSDALAAKANRNHTHGADDVNSGVFHIDRIPKLAIGWINGLTDQLAGLAAKNHSHPASDINSGQLHLDRVPAIPQSKVSGLVDALLGKSNTDHKHDAADVASGVFNVARIPALAMEKITGLIDALARYGELARSQTWTGSNTFRATIPVRAQQAASAGAGFVDLAGVSPNSSGSVVFRNAEGERLGYVGNIDTGGTLYISAVVPNIALNRRPTFAGQIAWDTGNFDPATKVDNQARHIADFNAAPSSAGLSVIHAGETPRGAPGAWAQGLQFGRARERMVQLLFDNQQGSGIYVRKTYGLPESPSWTDTVSLWHSGNLNPATKADLASPALTGNPTAPTQAAGNSSTRIATTAFVRQEVNTAIAPLATTAAMNAADALKAPLASPALTGTPTAPTQAAGNNSTRIATTAFVRQEVNSAIEPLATTAAMNAADALKAPLASPALTGNPTAPTQPSGNNSTRLATTAFVQSALTSAVSAGAVSYFARATAPAGWLAANGAAVSRTTYADLFAAIGTTFGAGNGSTTFNLPDLRGEFVRGLDDGRGIDAGRSLGSAQASQNLAHTHEYMEVMGVDNTQGGSGIQGGWFGYGATTSSSGGAEARPRNVALLACIKF
ncbi:tail fiber protein [Brevundimonas naejangsanensis]|uniref:tail fiber protein n=1 Tax=Brevundimonas naejangsanensis TaxID=588932 RepID=UPI0039F69D87